jgi:hypothetical protein
MIPIESSVLVRDSGTSGTLPQPRSGLANAREDAWPGGPSLENERIFSSIHRKGVFTLQIKRFSRYKDQWGVCKLREIEYMSENIVTSENTVLTVDNGESARAMKLNELITNAKKNTEVEE